jgi:hypothetical protein
VEGAAVCVRPRFPRSRHPVDEHHVECSNVCYRLLPGQSKKEAFRLPLPDESIGVDLFEVVFVFVP